VKAVLDSSVLISAFLTPDNPSGALVRAGLDERFEICVSLKILEETVRNLRSKPRLRRRYRYSDAAIDQYVEDLRSAVTVIEALPAIVPVCRDPDDDHILAAGLVAAADVIVTGDDDLLDIGVYRRIRVLTVRAFLKEL
jgi:putative PIN family toxin of toxin-antitoxin system